MCLSGEAEPCRAGGSSLPQWHIPLWCSTGCWKSSLSLSSPTISPELPLSARSPSATATSVTWKGIFSTVSVGIFNLSVLFCLRKAEPLCPCPVRGSLPQGVLLERMSLSYCSTRDSPQHIFTLSDPARALPLSLSSSLSSSLSAGDSWHEGRTHPQTLQNNSLY